MSDARTDSPTGQPEGGVSEEQARAYMEQLRSAPAEQVLAEVLGSVLNAAQVKLGRHDARLLIDIGGLMFDQARPYVSGDLAGQVEQALGQLRFAQVEAESAPGRQDEQGDLPRAPEPPGGVPGTEGGSSSGAPPAGSPSTGAPTSRAASTGTVGQAQGSGRSGGSSAGPKLWLPGRDF